MNPFPPQPRPIYPWAHRDTPKAMLDGMFLVLGWPITGPFLLKLALYAPVVAIQLWWEEREHG